MYSLLDRRDFLTSLHSFLDSISVMTTETLLVRRSSLLIFGLPFLFFFVRACTFTFGSLFSSGAGESSNEKGVRNVFFVLFF